MNILKPLSISAIISIGLFSNPLFAETQTQCLQVDIKNNYSENLVSNCYPIDNNISGNILIPHSEIYKGYDRITTSVAINGSPYLKTITKDKSIDFSYTEIKYYINGDQIELKYKENIITEKNTVADLNLFNSLIFNEQKNFKKNQSLNFSYNIYDDGSDNITDVVISLKNKA